jgi:DNA-binding response OmpR family regulator
MQRTILLADDDAAVRRMLCRLLSEENYRVIPASDIEDALQKLKAEPVDLVLLDLMLPRIDEGALRHQLRNEKSGLPFILISSQNGSTQAALRHAKDVIIHKPLDLLNLLTLIQELLQEPVKV